MTPFTYLVDRLTDVVNTAIPVVAWLAFLVFLWGVAKFIGKAGDTKSHEEGKSLLIWGVVALAVAVSVWGILRFARGEFGLTGDLALPLFDVKH